MKIRRKTTRIYPVGGGKFLEICKEWEMKFGAYLYYVHPWADGPAYPRKTLVRTSRFAEARQFVRDYKADARPEQDAALMEDIQ